MKLLIILFRTKYQMHKIKVLRGNKANNHFTKNDSIKHRQEKVWGVCRDTWVVGDSVRSAPCQVLRPTFHWQILLFWGDVSAYSSYCLVKTLEAFLYMFSECSIESRLTYHLHDQSDSLVFFSVLALLFENTSHRNFLKTNPKTWAMLQ